MANNCSYGQFDVSGLMWSRFTATDNVYRYTMAVCSPNWDEQCQAPRMYGGSVCQYDSGMRYVHMLGSFYGPTVPVWSLLREGNGVSVLLGNGDLCFHEGVSRARTVQINFVCSPVQNQTFAITTSTTNPCNYLIVLQTKMSGCRPPPVHCSATIGRTSYDLSPLTNQVFTYSDGSYQYKAGVCTSAFDSRCTYYTQGSSSNGTICQFANPSSTYMLSTYDPNTAPLPEWSLLNSTHPELGVALNMRNGDWCWSMGLRVQRHVIMLFLCDPSQTGSITNIHNVGDPCTYLITFPTRYGCPLSDVDDS